MESHHDNLKGRLKPGEEAEEYVRVYYAAKGVSLIRAQSGSGPDFRNVDSTLFVEVKGTKHKSISSVSPYLTDTQYRKAKECVENGTSFELHVVLGIGTQTKAHYVFPADFILSNIGKEVWWKLPLRKDARSFRVDERDQEGSAAKRLSRKIAIMEPSATPEENRTHASPSTLAKLLRRANSDTELLYLHLRNEILKVAPHSVERPTTTYVGFHESKMFVAVEIGTSFLTLWMLLGKTGWSSKDPRKRVEILGDDYKWTMKTRLKLRSVSDITYAQPLIEHARDVARRQSL